MITLEVLQKRMSQLNDWSLEEKKILKEFTFKDFKESILFTNQVAEIAERLYHHPTILISFNTVRIELTTHELSDLTEKDFDVAQEIDKINLDID